VAAARTSVGRARLQPLRPEVVHTASSSSLAQALLGLMTAGMAVAAAGAILPIMVASTPQEVAVMHPQAAAAVVAAIPTTPSREATVHAATMAAAVVVQLGGAQAAAVDRAAGGLRRQREVPSPTAAGESERAWVGAVVGGATGPLIRPHHLQVAGVRVPEEGQAKSALAESRRRSDLKRGAPAIT
jgi:hypothetical protein